jgi:hypothetical protein
MSVKQRVFEFLGCLVIYLTIAILTFFFDINIQLIFCCIFLILFNIVSFIFSYMFWRIREDSSIEPPLDGFRPSPGGLAVIAIICTFISVIMVIFRLFLTPWNDSFPSKSEIFLNVVNAIFIFMPAVPLITSWIQTVVHIYASARLYHVSNICMV